MTSLLSLISLAFPAATVGANVVVTGRYGAIGGAVAQLIGVSILNVICWKIGRKVFPVVYQ